MTRILFFHEMACTCVYLIEKAPWIKRKADKQLARYENGVWHSIAVEDLPTLSKIEAQVVIYHKQRFESSNTLDDKVWISLYNILLEPECRKKYDFNEHNKSVILRVSFLNQYL